MDLKNTIYLVFSIFVIVFIACCIFEFTFQIIPLFSKIVPENNKYKYIYIIDESSAKGSVYHNKISFPKIIQYVSSNKLDGKDIKIINLSMPGHGLIHQYWEYYLYRYTHPFNMGTVLIFSDGLLVN